ncbi:MAG: hypothetical protein WCU80_04650 [Paludibacteraceae bacterium]|nr:hypothetical protein [Prevotellaceae bacterium]
MDAFQSDQSSRRLFDRIYRIRQDYFLRHPTIGRRSLAFGRRGEAGDTTTWKKVLAEEYAVSPKKKRATAQASFPTTKRQFLSKSSQIIF